MAPRNRQFTSFRLCAISGVLVNLALMLYVLNLLDFGDRDIPGGDFPPVASSDVRSARSGPPEPRKGPPTTAPAPRPLDQPSFACTPAQLRRQSEAWCDHFAGRDNLPDALEMLRFLMPEATTFVDVGANKGLFSARIVDLWRPHYGVTSRRYRDAYLEPRFRSRGYAAGRRATCGVTDMCRDVDAGRRELIDALSPLPPSFLPGGDVLVRGEAAADDDDDPFVLHSFEPSPPIYKVHADIQNSTGYTEFLRRHWRWHLLAASNADGTVRFSAAVDEGSKIILEGSTFESKRRGQVMTELVEVRSVTLDSLAGYPPRNAGNATEEAAAENAKEASGDGPPPPLLFADPARTIDVLKVDAENVDAQVLEGAWWLLAAGRIRAVMWETPNRFPLAVFGGGRSVDSFGELIDALDRFAGMTCYFPARNARMIKLTGCYAGNLTAAKCEGKGVDFSNALCVSRAGLTEGAYRSLDARSLIFENSLFA